MKRIFPRHWPAPSPSALATPIAALALLWVAAGSFWKLVAPHPAAMPAPPAPSLQTAANIVAAAQPFGQPGAVAAPAASASAPANLRLLGTIASHGTMPGRALIALDGGPGKAAAEGETLEGVGEIGRVTEDSVEIRRNGQQLLLRLPERGIPQGKEAKR